MYFTRENLMCGNAIIGIVIGIIVLGPYTLMIHVEYDDSSLHSLEIVDLLSELIEHPLYTSKQNF
jgi:hypothetical protein